MVFYYLFRNRVYWYRQMQKTVVLVLVTLLFMSGFLILPGTAHAGYLDPGSGSTLVQGIIAVIASIKRFWRGFLGIFGIGRQD